MSAAAGATRSERRGTARPRPSFGRETELVRAVLELLHLHGIMAWRNNTGAVSVDLLRLNGAGCRGKRGFIRFGPKGGGDIFALLRGGPFLNIECKVRGNKPTEDQIIFARAVERAGHISLLVRDSIDDLDRWINWFRGDKSIPVPTEVYWHEPQ